MHRNAILRQRIRARMALECTNLSIVYRRKRRVKLEAPIEVAGMTAVIPMRVETTSRGLVGGTAIRRRGKLDEGLPVKQSRRAPHQKKSPA